MPCGKAVEKTPLKIKKAKPDFFIELGDSAKNAGFPLSYPDCCWFNLNRVDHVLRKSGHFHFLEDILKRIRCAIITVTLNFVMNGSSDGASPTVCFFPRFGLRSG
jgi:hypothetical protein